MTSLAQKCTRARTHPSRRKLACLLQMSHMIGGCASKWDISWERGVDGSFVPKNKASLRAGSWPQQIFSLNFVQQDRLRPLGVKFSMQASNSLMDIGASWSATFGLIMQHYATPSANGLQCVQQPHPLWGINKHHWTLLDGRVTRVCSRSRCEQQACKPLDLKLCPTLLKHSEW